MGDILFLYQHHPSLHTCRGRQSELSAFAPRNNSQVCPVEIDLGNKHDNHESLFGGIGDSEISAKGSSLVLVSS